MLGQELRWQQGFDCQGLWVEVEVEKELGFKSKRDIEEFGIAQFVEKCKERVKKFAAIQTQQSVRLGESSVRTRSCDHGRRRRRMRVTYVVDGQRTLACRSGCGGGSRDDGRSDIHHLDECSVT